MCSRVCSVICSQLRKCDPIFNANAPGRVPPFLTPLPPTTHLFPDHSVWILRILSCFRDALLSAGANLPTLEACIVSWCHAYNISVYKNTSEVPALPRCRKREFKRNLYSFPFLLSSAFVMCCALSARSNASFRNLFSLPVTIWCVVKPVLTSPKIMQKCETIDYNLRAYVTILSQIKA